MKVTVCELTNEMAYIDGAWQALAEHVQELGSDLVLLPEMPFYRWLAHVRDVDATEWMASVKAHERWLLRLESLSPATVVGTCPVLRGKARLNEGFCWNATSGYQAVHSKYYLPDETAFWEASWYDRGDGVFQVHDTAAGRIGMLICTEIWFLQRAREYAKQSVQLLLCPRATPTGTGDKWLAGGRVAAVVSGAYCLSSNLSGRTTQGGDYGGLGWVIGPEVGDVLGVTSSEKPFLTVEINLALADRAKSTYPRYVAD